MRNKLIIILIQIYLLVNAGNLSVFAKQSSCLKKQKAISGLAADNTEFFKELDPEKIGDIYDKLFKKLKNLDTKDTKNIATAIAKNKTIKISKENLGEKTITFIKYFSNKYLKCLLLLGLSYPIIFINIFFIAGLNIYIAVLLPILIAAASPILMIIADKFKKIIVKKIAEQRDQFEKYFKFIEICIMAGVFLGAVSVSIISCVLFLHTSYFMFFVIILLISIISFFAQIIIYYLYNFAKNDSRLEKDKKKQKILEKQGLLKEFDFKKSNTYLKGIIKKGNVKIDEMELIKVVVSVLNVIKHNYPELVNDDTFNFIIANTIINSEFQKGMQANIRMELGKGLFKSPIYLIAITAHEIMHNIIDINNLFENNDYEVEQKLRKDIIYEGVDEFIADAMGFSIMQILEIDKKKIAGIFEYLYKYSGKNDNIDDPHYPGRILTKHFTRIEMFLNEKKESLFGNEFKSYMPELDWKKVLKQGFFMLKDIQKNAKIEKSIDYKKYLKNLVLRYHGIESDTLGANLLSDKYNESGVSAKTVFPSKEELNSMKDLIKSV